MINIIYTRHPIFLFLICFLAAPFGNAQTTTRSRQQIPNTLPISKVTQSTLRQIMESESEIKPDTIITLDDGSLQASFSNGWVVRIMDPKQNHMRIQMESTWRLNEDDRSKKLELVNRLNRTKSIGQFWISDDGKVLICTHTLLIPETFQKAQFLHNLLVFQDGVMRARDSQVDLDTLLSERVFGIGAVLSEPKAKSAFPMVDSIVPQSPAQAAGIQPQSYIESIDGVSCRGLTVEQTKSMITNPERQTVTIGVRSPDPGSNFREITLRKMLIRPQASLPAVSRASLENQPSSGDLAEWTALEVQMMEALPAMISVERAQGGKRGAAAVEVGEKFLNAKTPEGLVEASAAFKARKADLNPEFANYLKGFAMVKINLARAGAPETSEAPAATPPRPPAKKNTPTPANASKPAPSDPDTPRRRSPF